MKLGDNILKFTIVITHVFEIGYSNQTKNKDHSSNLQDPHIHKEKL